jgi:hypothetical protein
LARAAEVWAKNRAIYPGWLVAPSSVRARVWSGTFHWVGGIRSAVEPLGPRQRLSVLGELLWRLEVALVGSSIDSEFEALLRETLEAADAEVRCLRYPDGTEVDLDACEWAVVQAGYAELARCARTRGDKDAFGRWLARLARASLGDANISHSVRYERCLWSLQRLEHGELEQLLDAWVVDGADPIWAMRKAGKAPPRRAWRRPSPTPKP